MKTKLLLLTLLLLSVGAASAYQHLWTGTASGLWNLGQNWTNGVPSSSEARMLKLLFLDDGSDGGMVRNTVQDIPGLVVDYMEVRGPFHFSGGFNHKLSFRDTNGASSASATLFLQSSPVFESDLEIGLTMPIALTALLSSFPNEPGARFNGPITGPGEWRHSGGGRIEFGGNRANTFAGALTVADGQLRLNKDGAAAVPGQLVLGFGAPGRVNGSVLCVRSNQFAPGATAIIHRDGLLDLDDHSQTISGLTLNGGRVTSRDGLLTVNGPVVANPAGTNSRMDGLVFLGFVPRSFTVGGETRDDGLRINARVSGAAGASLVKDGPGTLTLAGTNVYSGSTVVNQGAIVATGPSPLGNTNSGTFVQAGSTLRLEFGSLGDEPLTLSGHGVGGAGALSVFGSSTGTGPVTLAADADIAIWPGHTLGLNGVVLGAGGLRLTSGTLALGGTSANTFAGTTRVDGGTLELRKHITIIGGSDINIVSVPGPLMVGDGSGVDTVRLFADGAIAQTAPVTTTLGGQLDLNGFDVTIGSLAGPAGQIMLGTGELTIGGNGSSTTSGAVISGNGRVRKIGPGTLTLTAVSTHSLGTSVEGGTLVAGGSVGNIAVKTNGTLAGTGFVGSLAVQGGVVSPGVGRGRLHSKSVVFNSASNGSIFRVELYGPIAGGSYDQLDVVGSVNLGGCTLEADLGFAGAPGQQYIIIANDEADAVIGSFAGKPEGAIFSSSGAQFQITYHGGDGNDVVLTQLTTSTQEFGPELRMEKFVENQVRLLWTVNAPGFQLETTASMPGNPWQPVPGLPGVVANEFFLDVPIWTNNAKFFRLVKP